MSEMHELDDPRLKAIGEEWSARSEALERAMTEAVLALAPIFAQAIELMQRAVETIGRDLPELMEQHKRSSARGAANRFALQCVAPHRFDYKDRPRGKRRTGGLYWEGRKL